MKMFIGIAGYFRRVASCSFLFALGTLVSPLRADVKPAGLFGDNMVLQQNIKLPVWGRAAPGETITVSMEGQEAATVADKDGKWMVKLGPFSAGGPFAMIIMGKNKITIKNVLVGEVWVCSGQSNMAVPVSASLNAKEEMAGANYPNIRYFGINANSSPTIQEDCGGVWQVCNPQTVNGFSAVAYFFARELSLKRKVPIGLINNSVGGTPAEAWTPLAVLQSDPDFKSILDDYAKACESFPAKKIEFDRQVKEWEEASKKAKADGTQPPSYPWPPMGPGHKQAPYGLYNSKVHPLIPYGIQGVIWYQGENNAEDENRGIQYRKLFPAMIRSWRKEWGQGDFPFLFVQLANYAYAQTRYSWPVLREAQLMALEKVPNAGMAVAIDIGESFDVHPKNKQEVGRRLALLARARVYGEKVVCSGPFYKSMAVDGNGIRIRFKETGGGLMAKGGDLQGFIIAGDDKVFVPAKARIGGGDTVVVSSDKVKKPTAVRYGWEDDPRCNLYNKQGLPASPFRTDRWPGKPNLIKIKKKLVAKPALKPIVMDGNLDLQEWKSTESCELGIYRSRQEKTADDIMTKVRLRYDSRNLYVAFECHEPQISNLKLKSVGRDGDVYSLDEVELFLDPEYSGKKSMHFMAAPIGGSWYDERKGYRKDSSELSELKGWDPDWKYVFWIYPEKKIWTMTMAIPYESLGVKAPVPGTVWAGNFARVRRASGKEELFCWTGDDFGDPEYYGEIVFE